jgi:hypothetical protein
MKNRSSSFFLCIPGMSLPVLASLTTVVLCSGCGSETYDQRLDETVQYFAYVDTRNQALAGTWSSPTIQFRPPLDFQEIQATQSVATATTDGENGEAESAAPVQSIDPRQPDYADLKLPGLDGAWRTEVPVDADNETVDRPAYLYVLSNYSLLKNKEKEAALNFFGEVNNQIASTFNQFLNTDDFVTERFPRSKGYTEPKSFTYGTFTPEMPIDGVPYEIQIYLSESGDNQAVVLIVLPQNTLRKSKLQDQIDYSLETFDLHSAQDGSGGSAPQSTQF